MYSQQKDVLWNLYKKQLNEMLSWFVEEEKEIQIRCVIQHNTVNIYEPRRNRLKKPTYSVQEAIADCDCSAARNCSIRFQDYALVSKAWLSTGNDYSRTNYAQAHSAPSLIEELTLHDTHADHTLPLIGSSFVILSAK